MSKIIALVVIVLLASCSLWEKRPENMVDTVEIQKRVKPVEVLHPPLPQSVTWEHFKWVALTPEILRNLLKKYDTGEISEDDMVFFAVTPDGYGHLSIDVGEMLRYIEDQKGVIMYYRETIPKEIFLPSQKPD
jgi:hypothetical protein